MTPVLSRHALSYGWVIAVLCKHQYFHVTHYLMDGITATWSMMVMNIAIMDQNDDE